MNSAKPASPPSASTAPYLSRATNPKPIASTTWAPKSPQKHFGNDCNVMAEILLSRYDLFVSRKMITHLTTNLNSSEIESLYGLRVRSRLREQFNLIAFGESAKDKRC